jgi:hypothetical protein
VFLGKGALDFPTITFTGAEEMDKCAEDQERLDPFRLGDAGLLMVNDIRLLIVEPPFDPAPLLILGQRMVDFCPLGHKHQVLLHLHPPISG